MTTNDNALPAAESRSSDDAAAAAEAFQRGETRLVYHQAGGVPAPPPPESEPMVVRGLRLPVALDRRVRAAAEAMGVSYSAVIREWIEVGLTEAENDRPISLAAVRRAIAHAAQSGAAA